MGNGILKDPNVDAFAARLLNEPYFKDGTLTLYADVPVKCIQYNLPFHICHSNPCSDRERYAQVVLNFVVCYGDKVLLCICFDEDERQYETMFKTYLYPMDYVRHNFLKLLPEDLEQLLAEVLEKLRFFTDYQLATEHYSLIPVEITAGIELLQSKRFLCEDPMSFFYSRDCGLFVQCKLDSEGGVMRKPLTSAAMEEVFFEALNWEPKENYCTNDLRQLLRMPLEEFFRMRPDMLNFLRQNLNGVRRKLGGYEEREFATYGDCLLLLRDIRRRLRNPETVQQRDWLEWTQKAILNAFCEIISKWYIPFFQLPLLHHCTAAANLAGCYYPIWLYRRKIAPHSCNRPNDSFASSEFAQACLPHIMRREQPGAAFMLGELMTLPVCTPEAQ